MLGSNPNSGSFAFLQVWPFFVFPSLGFFSFSNTIPVFWMSAARFSVISRDGFLSGRGREAQGLGAESGSSGDTQGQTGSWGSLCRASPRGPGRRARGRGRPWGRAQRVRRRARAGGRRVGPRRTRPLERASRARLPSSGAPPPHPGPGGRRRRGRRWRRRGPPGGAGLPRSRDAGTPRVSPPGPRSPGRASPPAPRKGPRTPASSCSAEGELGNRRGVGFVDPEAPTPTPSRVDRKTG